MAGATLKSATSRGKCMCNTDCKRTGAGDAGRTATVRVSHWVPDTNIAKMQFHNYKVAPLRVCLGDDAGLVRVPALH